MWLKWSRAVIPWNWYVDIEKEKLWITVWWLVGHFPVLQRRSHVFSRRQQGQYTQRKETSRDERWQRWRWYQDGVPSYCSVGPESCRFFLQFCEPFSSFLTTKTNTFTLCLITQFYNIPNFVNLSLHRIAMFQRTQQIPGFFISIP